ncbi:hypothetical protein ABG067_003371 [Albugo candida]
MDNLDVPSNLSLAPQNPIPAPRLIKKASEGSRIIPARLRPEFNVSLVIYDDIGRPIVNMLSFKDESVVNSLALDPSVFNAPLRKDILHRVVRWQLACRRSGNHKAKSRSETRGSTRKVRPQKGGGQARVGDLRAPQWRGGYCVHGPVVRDHSYTLQKKVRAMGIRVALSEKLREGKLAIVENLDWDIVKTKELRDLLKARNWDNALFVDGEEVTTNFILSSRNIPCIDVIPQHKINVYSILKRDLLISTVDAIKYFEDRFHVD